MPTPGEHKTVHARILACAQEIGWSFVSREEAEQRRGFEPKTIRPIRQAHSRRTQVGMAQMGADLQRPESHLRKSVKSAVHQIKQKTLRPIKVEY